MGVNEVFPNLVPRLFINLKKERPGYEASVLRPFHSLDFDCLQNANERSGSIYWGEGERDPQGKVCINKLRFLHFVNLSNSPVLG